MIVKMKKVFIISQTKDAGEAAKALRGLGVVHVEHQQKPAGKDVASLQDDLALIERASEVLSEPDLETPGRFIRVRKLRDWRFAARYIVDLRSRLDQLKEFSQNLLVRISQWEAWGDFDPDTIRALEAKGLRVKLYTIPVKDLDKLPADVVIREIFRAGGAVGCAVISQKEVNIPFKEMALPAMGLKAMKTRLEEDRAAMKKLHADLAKCSRYRDRFKRIRKAFEKELELHEAARGMAQSGTLSYLAGYIPFDQAAAVTEAARRERWAVVISDPAEEDNVPTLVRNPRWVSIIEPVFRLIEIVPGYHELDISLWFLIFFSIFFGMIIGDAAYGAIFMIITAIVQFRFGARIRNKSPFVLMYVLSSCAIAWGILTGTVFGQEWLPQWVKPVAPALRNDKNVQALCFLLGTVHLSIAHIWRAILKWPSLTALADVGWTVTLWGMLFLAKFLILGYALPPFVKWLFILGPLLVVLFASPNRNVLKGVGAGLGTLALSFMNTFTDIVSYVRLFAVGLATVAVADAFNKMALEVGFGNFFSGLATALILVLGHSLNIALGPMSVLVHGVRLNVLEFCSHVDIKWSGFRYRPLREEKAGS